MQSKDPLPNSHTFLEKVPPAVEVETFGALSENPTLEGFTSAIAAAIAEKGFTDFSLAPIDLPHYERVSTLSGETGSLNALMDIVREHFQTDGTPLLLSDVERHIGAYPVRSPRIAKGADNLQRLAESGFREGYFLTHTTDKGKKHLFALYSRHASRRDFKQCLEQSRQSLPALLEAILFFGMEHLPSHFLGAGQPGPMLLKPKPGKMLELLGKEGLMLKEAAPLLGVRLDTINRYCADLKKMFGCRSMPQVIYRACRLGIIAAPEADASLPPKLPDAERRSPTVGCDKAPAAVCNKESEGAGPQNAAEESGTDGHFFSQLAGCTTLIQWRESIFSIVRQLGFTDWSLTPLQALPNSHFTSLPQAVEEFCHQEAFVKVDFRREHAAGSDIPLFLSALEQFTARSPLSSPRNRWNAAYFERLASFGYHDGYCIPHSIGRDSGRAIFSLFARDASREEFRVRVERCQSLLPMLVGAIIYFGFTYFPEHFLPVKPRKIKPRALATLSAVIKEGLTMKEAERRLYMSEFTASEHINSAKKALGATTLMNAAYLATVRGLIKEDKEGG